MHSTTTAPIGAAEAGFAPSQTLLQTSVTRATVNPAVRRVTLPDNVLPLAPPPAGYAHADVLVIENGGHDPLEWCPWSQANPPPAAWSGHIVGPGHAVRLNPSPLSATGQALLVRSKGLSPLPVTIRRGVATNLTE
jgi:hypothetical protein